MPLQEAPLCRENSIKAPNVESDTRNSTHVLAHSRSMGGQGSWPARGVSCRAPRRRGAAKRREEGGWRADRRTVHGYGRCTRHGHGRRTRHGHRWCAGARGGAPHALLGWDVSCRLKRPCVRLAAALLACFMHRCATGRRHRCVGRGGSCRCCPRSARPWSTRFRRRARRRTSRKVLGLRGAPGPCCTTPAPRHCRGSCPSDACGCRARQCTCHSRRGPRRAAAERAWAAAAAAVPAAGTARPRRGLYP
mmetsp:Transcript_13223/g.28543  ORF Transcript_13223/g.28543 Transcript_13223/m.28543 type:complete len:249 (-) Transcript_13223:26-772(-)